MASHRQRPSASQWGMKCIAHRGHEHLNERQPMKPSRLRQKEHCIMSKPNGWKAQSARHGKPPEPIVWTPSEWEELLRKLSLSESQAAQIVTGFENDHLAKLLRLWIRD